EIRADFQLDAVITVVDVPQLIAGELESGKPIPGGLSPEAPSHIDAVDTILLQQLENADVVILNKIDELSEDDLRERVTSRYPDAAPLPSRPRCRRRRTAQSSAESPW
ncbi:MAG: hypothetical protein EBV42_01565, partial [Actinobacteria bacterium]|nr:hypothetical protein [Actinomycetota bacterium]